MNWKVILILIAVVVVYLSLGGVGFFFLEGDNEEGRTVAMQDMLSNFIAQNPCVTSEELSTLLRAFSQAQDQGVLVLPGETVQTNWDFASCVFFSLTAITTIGYGNISPSTDGGRTFAVFYALIGIPITLVLLAGIGEKLLSLFKKMEERMDCDCCQREKYKKLFRGLRLTLIMLIGVLIFIFIPAIAFTYVDGWSYSEALYYCVVTLTTVGFGDYVAGSEVEDNRALYRILCCMWIFIGLAWLAGVISYLQDTVTNLLDKSPKEKDEKSAEEGTEAGDIPEKSSKISQVAPVSE